MREDLVERAAKAGERHGERLGHMLGDTFRWLWIGAIFIVGGRLAGLTHEQALGGLLMMMAFFAARDTDSRRK